MANRPHSRAFANPSAPSAWGRCDRCGFIYLHKSLRFQFDYRGPRLTNLRILVCASCYDKPQPQLKPIMLTQDPLPIINARPEDYNYASDDQITTQDGNQIVTEDGVYVDTQPIGKPAHLDPNAMPPLYLGEAYNQLLPVISLSVDNSNNYNVNVTTSAPHGLANNAQISIVGATNNNIDGFYNITYVSATAFYYTVATSIPAGNYLQGTTRVVNAIVGVPRDFAQIPQTGV